MHIQPSLYQQIRAAKSPNFKPQHQMLVENTQFETISLNSTSSPVPASSSWLDFPLVSGDEKCLPENMRQFTKNKKIKSKRKLKKSVRFSHAEVREHTIIVGDHPSTDSLPISLGWEHSQSEFYDLETYEKYQSEFRRGCVGMKLNYFQRKNLLKSVGGLTDVDLARAEKGVTKKRRDGHFQKHVCSVADVESLEFDMITLDI